MPRLHASHTASQSAASCQRRPRFRPCLDLLEDRINPVSFGFALAMGAGSIDIGQAVATDASGNVYLAGYFQNTVDFDPGAGTANLTSTGGEDIFVAKYTSTGALVWAQHMGGAASERGYGIALNPAGDVYTTGYFNGTADFDPGAGTFNLTAASNDIFVSKLDSAGNFAWAARLGSGSIDQGRKIAVDAAGNAYTTGYFSATADFDPGPGTFNLSGAGNDDIFISKLDSAGNFVWARGMGSAGLDEAIGLALDPAGNVYTTGHFKNTVDFDPGAGTSNLTSSGPGDPFISKLDSAGNFVLARNMGSTNADAGYAIAADASGNIYTAGYFQGTADLDPGAGTTNLTSVGARDIYIAKLDSAANLLWAHNIGTTNDDAPRDVTLDAAGNVYATGAIDGTADFDPGPGTFNLTSVGSNDIFIAKFDSAGNFAWAGDIGSGVTDYGNSIAVDPSGSIYATGYFQGTVDFDPGPGTVNRSSTGTWDIFLVKLGQPGVIIAASGGSTNVTEGGAADTCSVVLNDFPTANVLITFTPDAQVAAATTILTFTPANWNIAQTVNVTAVDDALIEGNHTGVLAFTTSSVDANYNAFAVPSLTADITDNDALTAGVTIVESSGATDVAESGGTDSYTVVLTSIPTANVVITPSTGGVITVAPTNLTFTPANWNIAQLVTVTAVDDAVAEGGQSVTITHAAASIDLAYNAIAIASVTVAVADNDVAGAVVNPASLALAEGTPGSTYAVTLSSQPTANVILTLDPGTQLTLSSTTFTFTPLDWNTPHYVTVTALDDTPDEGPHTGTVTHVASSTDAMYNGLPIATLTTTIADNDASGNTLSISGTPSADKIVVTNSTDFTKINVSCNGKTTSYPSSLTQLFIATSGGNDDIQIYNPLIPIVIVGGQNSDKVLVAGAKTANAFSLGKGFVSVNGVNIGLFEVEIVIAAGNIAADAFTIQDTPSYTAELRGDQGSDQINAADRPNTWQITNPNAGSLNTSIKFTAVENLTGGSSTDGFFFSAGRSISGAIDGGAGTNKLDYALYTSPVSVNLQAATASGMKSFQNIGQIGGGKSLADKLVGLDQANTWDVTDWNAGSVNGVSFQNIENLSGGQLDDAFVFADNRGVKGKLDGRGGNNSIDYSSYLANPVTVNLQSHLATNLAGFDNVQQFQGGSALDTLIGANQASTWNLTASNSGTVNGLSFAAFENLTGGLKNDFFSLNVNADWTGLLHGGSGIDTLSAFAGSVYTTTGPGTGLLNGRKFQSIEYRL